MSLSAGLIIDKSEGPTSHDVVWTARRLFQERRIGHAGTLDPMATGVLVLLLGEATKLEPYVSGADKVYEATVGLGTETDTLDRLGQPTRSTEVPRSVLEELACGVIGPRLRDALATELARTEQIPPAYSAIHVDGVRSHTLARQGRAAELPARPVAVRSIEMLNASSSPATVSFRLTTSKGYYVRSFARDIAASLGTLGHLIALRRVRSGAFPVEEGSPLLTPEDLPQARAALIPLGDLVRRVMPTLVLTSEGVERARCGKVVRPSDASGPPLLPDLNVALVADDGSPVAIGRALAPDASEIKILRGFCVP